MACLKCREPYASGMAPARLRLSFPDGPLRHSCAPGCDAAPHVAGGRCGEPLPWLFDGDADATAHPAAAHALSSPPVRRAEAPTLARACTRALLRLFGWRTVVVPLPAPHGIIVIYPHTSNWDFIVGLLYKVSAGLPIRWMGKHTLFRWPVRRLFMRLGGIPIRRDQRSNSVELLWLNSRAGIACGLRWLPRYSLAHRSLEIRLLSHCRGRQAAPGPGVHRLCDPTVGIDTYLTLTGDAALDFARIREFYQDKRGRRPENAGDVRLRD